MPTRTLCCLLAAVLVGLALPASAVVIDDFSVGQPVVSDPPGSASSVAAAGVIGSSRDLAVKLRMGAGPVTSLVTGGALSFAVTATTPDSRGEAVVTWDGDLNPLGLSFFGTPQDLLSSGHRSFRIVVNSAGAGTEIELEVYTNAGNSSVAALRLPAVAAATNFFLSYGPGGDFVTRLGTGADFTTVGALVMTVRGTETTASIDLVETVAPAVGATKRDLDLSNVAIVAPQAPGGTYKYRVTITNTGGEAQRVDFNDVNTDPNITLDPATADATPIARNDAYRTFGNVPITVTAGANLYDCDPSNSVGLLNNDCDPDTIDETPPDPNELAITTVGVIATTLGGSADVSADGSFTYSPPVGVGRAVDTFGYTVADNDGNTANATVTIDIGRRIWFVDDADPGGANLGTRDEPFVGFTATNVAGAGGLGDVDGPEDVIFLFEGNHVSGIELEADQILWGHGEALVLDGVTIVPVGTAPTITSAANGITLSTNNTLRALTVGNTAGVDILGTSFGLLTASNVTLNGNGGALNLTNGILAATFNSIASASGTRGIDLNFTAGSLTVAGATNLSNVSEGLRIQNSPTLTTSFNNTASFTASAGRGILLVSAGTVSFTGSSNTSVGTGGAGVHITSTSLGAGAIFATVSSSGSPVKGINLDTVTGSFVANGGSISGAGEVAFDVNAGSSTITYAGGITNTANRSVEITGRTGGTVTLSGNINDTGTGINIANNNASGSPIINLSGGTKTLSTGANPAVTLDNNDVANVNFTGGGLAITTTSGIGFNAINGAAGISVQGSGNTITSTTGTALNVASTTIGASGLTFQSISSNGGTNGIVLNATGSSGSLTVTGTGGAGTGGTIQNKAIGISLTNTRNPSFSWMQLNDHSDFAIRGSSVLGFTLANTVISGVNGNDAAADEGSVRFTELTGGANVTNCNISGGFEDNFKVINTTGTLDRITFSSTTIGPNSTTDGNDGIALESTGATTVLNATVQNSFFTSSRGDLFQLNVIGNSTSNLIFTGNQLSNNHPGIATGGGGVTISGGDNTGAGANLTMSMTSNTFRDADGHAVLFVKSTDPGTFRGTFSNNQIGVAATADSGSRAGSGIKVQNAGLGAVTVAITNNQIRQYNNFGIELLTGGGAMALSGALNATVTGNTVSNPGTGGLPMNGVHLNGGTVPGDTYQICTDVGGAGALANALVGSGANGGTDFRLRQRQATTVRLPGYAGANNNDAAVVTFVQGRNTGGPSGLVSNNVPTGGGFVGGAACPTP